MAISSLHFLILAVQSHIEYGILGLNDKINLGIISIEVEFNLVPSAYIAYQYCVDGERIGPKMEPCGIPDFNETNGDLLPSKRGTPIFTACFLSVK